MTNNKLLTKAEFNQYCFSLEWHFFSHFGGFYYWGA